jgi:cyanophycinase
MVPKGKLLIIGGAEDKSGSELAMLKRNSQSERFEILKELLPSSDFNARIEVITTASQCPHVMQQTYHDTFTEIGYKNVGFMDIVTKMQAREEALCERIDKAKAVFFTGGDQLRLSTIIGGTTFADTLRKKYIEDENFTIAGTSAGAMVMSRIMICGGGTDEALLGSDLHTASGFGLLKDCIVDTHFIKRGRFSRLAHAVIINPGNLGIGLGEDTALIITNGNDATCRGSGMVVVIDGTDIEQTNISEADDGCPVYVENLKVHLLIEYCKFNLKTRQMSVPAPKISSSN